MKAFFALALVLTTLLHATAVPLATGTDLNAYRLPDGSLPVLCLGKGDDSGRDGAQGSSCPYCTLSAMPALPDSADQMTPPDVRSVSHGCLRSTGRQAQADETGFRARAPPLSEG